VCACVVRVARNVLSGMCEMTEGEGPWKGRVYVEVNGMAARFSFDQRQVKNRRDVGRQV
jgi:hypothetical protein